MDDRTSDLEMDPIVDFWGAELSAKQKQVRLPSHGDEIEPNEIVKLEPRHRYDPSINIDNFDENEEMNNGKVSPGSSSSAGDLGDVFVFNNLRKGGPLSGRGNGASAGSGKPKKNCKVPGCPVKTQDRYNGHRFVCSQPSSRRSEVQERRYKERHKFCWDCAMKRHCPCPDCHHSPTLPLSLDREPQLVDWTRSNHGVRRYHAPHC